MKKRFFSLVLIFFCITYLQAKIEVRNWVYSIDEHTPYVDSASIGKYGWCLNKAVHTCSVKLRITHQTNLLGHSTLNIINTTHHQDSCVVREAYKRLFTKDRVYASWTTRSQCVQVSGSIYNCNLTQTSGSFSDSRDGNLRSYYSQITDHHIERIPLLCYTWPIVASKHTIVFNSKTGKFTLRWLDGQRISDGKSQEWVLMEGTAGQM